MFTSRSIRGMWKLEKSSSENPEIRSVAKGVVDELCLASLELELSSLAMGRTYFSILLFRLNAAFYYFIFYFIIMFYV